MYICYIFASKGNLQAKYIPMYTSFYSIGPMGWKRVPKYGFGGRATGSTISITSSFDPHLAELVKKSIDRESGFPNPPKDEASGKHRAAIFDELNDRKIGYLNQNKQEDSQWLADSKYHFYHATKNLLSFIALHALTIVHTTLAMEIPDQTLKVTEDMKSMENTDMAGKLEFRNNLNEEQCKQNQETIKSMNKDIQEIREHIEF
ncbi:hypothetical protein H4Q26_013428 [Puccinia striiformis f. sp. tritici PST-130]|nr:hypothetical protein H4Q26_013428 [Puccinia striiformis f. sp. tritici PST-130]